MLGAPAGRGEGRRGREPRAARPPPVPRGGVRVPTAGRAAPQGGAPRSGQLRETRGPRAGAQAGGGPCEPPASPPRARRPPARQGARTHPRSWGRAGHTPGRAGPAGPPQEPGPARAPSRALRAPPAASRSQAAPQQRRARRPPGLPAGGDAGRPRGQSSPAAQVPAAQVAAGKLPPGQAGRCSVAGTGSKCAEEKRFTGKVGTDLLAVTATRRFPARRSPGLGWSRPHDARVRLSTWGGARAGSWLRPPGRDPRPPRGYFPNARGEPLRPRVPAPARSRLAREQQMRGAAPRSQPRGDAPWEPGVPTASRAGLCPRMFPEEWREGGKPAPARGRHSAKSESCLVSFYPP